MNYRYLASIAIQALSFTLLALPLRAQKPFRITKGQSVSIIVDKEAESPVWQAARMLAGDLERVLSVKVSVTEEAKRVETADSPSIEIVTKSESFASGSHEAFRLSQTPSGSLLVEGSDALGTAYGSLEISRRLGVSPWEWWTEAEVAPLQEFSLSLPSPVEDAPIVEHRGIFINDEDWGLAPWSTRQEQHPDTISGPWRYTIGPKVTERICQLLLRLRADTYWPAMHSDTRPFFFTAGNREVVKKYGIFIGTSHCEPLAANTNGEWPVRGQGEYNFASNSEGVKAFWQQRLDEVAGQPVIYTLGIRGRHDDPMLGATTVEEQKALLERVFETQQQMLATAFDGRKDKAPQIFIPYKEVLDVVDAGLKIPDNAPIIQCDDNYGFIRWPQDSMLSRPAGTGLYYHVSYFGRPHDYLWLSSTHPRLMQEELVRFALSGRQYLWVLNVGDIKPAEYQIQLFMDIAWNPLAFSQSEAWKAHLRHFLGENLPLSLSAAAADSLTETLSNFYDIVFRCRPEFLAGTRVEEADPLWTIAADLPWSERQLTSYRDSLLALSDRVERTAPSTAWMHLVQYPVQGAAQMAVKQVGATLARHGLADWAESDCAYDSIQSLTTRYNTGRWQGFMDASPRNLTVFRKAERTTCDTPLPVDESSLLTVSWSDSLCLLREGEQLPPLRFDTPEESRGEELVVEVSVLPTHPRHGEPLCLSVSLDGGEPQSLDFTTQGRSEEWKQNVLRNKAVRRLSLATTKGQSHTLIISHLSGGEIFPLEVRVLPGVQH